MPFRFLVLALGLLLASAGAASVSASTEVKLAWDPSPDSTVVGYRIYFGFPGGPLTNTVEVGDTTTASVTGLIPALTYLFHVRAFDADGLESDPSNEVSFTIPQVTPANNPPTLVPIFQQVVNVGSTLEFTALAADSNPFQTLTFSLEGDVPGGASIDPATGFFQWQPSPAQAPSTNEIVIVVTDDGAPAMSTSQAVTIVVQAPNTSSQMHTLKLEGFKNGFVDVSPRGNGKAGHKYEEGSMVTFTATPGEGATFEGWVVNGQTLSANPLTVTITQNTLVAPSFKTSSIRPTADDPAGGLSMRISQAPGEALITIGGEVGAWALESSPNLVDWVETAWGITSEVLSVPAQGNAFFRVRPAPEVWEE